jgi:hypothetical protein
VAPPPNATLSLNLPLQKKAPQSHCKSGWLQTSRRTPDDWPLSSICSHESASIASTSDGLTAGTSIGLIDNDRALNMLQPLRDLATQCLDSNLKHVTIRIGLSAVPSSAANCFGGPIDLFIHYPLEPAKRLNDPKCTMAWLPFAPRYPGPTK